MKNYEKIPFNQISNIESYVEEKLRAGHIIIQILVNEDKKEISELVSYANDKGCKSCYRNFAGLDEILKASVIKEVLNPYYAYKDNIESENEHYTDIDIETDEHYITNFLSFKKDFRNMEEYYNGDSFQDEDAGMMHYEFYISIDKGDIANFGGSLELDFIEEWMTEHGYYSK